MGACGSRGSAGKPDSYVRIAGHVAWITAHVPSARVGGAALPVEAKTGGGEAWDYVLLVMMVMVATCCMSLSAICSRFAKLDLTRVGESCRRFVNLYPQVGPPKAQREPEDDASVGVHSRVAP